jgi:glycosyltransferase involved in cell wall biosynthesis
VMRLSDSCAEVAIIVPTSNSASDCLSCLESLMKLAYPDVEVTVVDDGSADGTSEAISRLYPKVRILGGTEISGGLASGLSYAGFSEI